MSSFHDEILAGFEATLELVRDAEDGSCLFQWPLNSDRTPTYPRRFIDCISSVTPDALTLVAGGMLQDYQFSLTCRKSDFPDITDFNQLSGSLIRKNNRVSRILTPETNDLTPLVVFHCGTPDK